jgi:hypothetical protein
LPKQVTGSEPEAKRIVQAKVTSTPLATLEVWAEGIDLPDLRKRWREYAEKWVGTMPAAEARENLWQLIKEDFELWFDLDPDIYYDPELEQAAAKFASAFVVSLSEAVPELASDLAPAVAQPEEAEEEEGAEAQKGEEEEQVTPPEELLGEVEPEPVPEELQEWSEIPEEQLQPAPDAEIVFPEEEEEPFPLEDEEIEVPPESEPPPAEEEPPQPEPEPTEEPTPEQPTEPAGQQVVATGTFTNCDQCGVPDWKAEDNTMQLTFNTAGGPVSGGGTVKLTGPPNMYPDVCPAEKRYKYSLTVTIDQSSSTYSPDTKTFSGTFTLEEILTTYVLEPDPDTLETVCIEKVTTDTEPRTWSATLQDGIVEGVGYGWAFELTVQGQ